MNSVDEQRGMSLGRCLSRNGKETRAGDRTRVVLRQGDPQDQKPKVVQENNNKDTSRFGDQEAAGQGR